MVPTGSSSHDATAASNSPSPGQTASPTHPLDISFLLELPGDVVALGPDGAISHVKSAASTLEPVWHAVPNSGDGDCFDLFCFFSRTSSGHLTQHVVKLQGGCRITSTILHIMKLDWLLKLGLQQNGMQMPPCTRLLRFPPAVPMCCVLSARLSASCLVSFCRPSSGILPMLALY